MPIEKDTEIKDVRTKICSGPCKEEKLRSEFYPRNDRPNGLQSRCKVCQNESRWSKGRFRSQEDKERIYVTNKISYQKNKAKYQKRANERTYKNKIRALEAHGSEVCMICKFDHPAALDFHHRDPTTKRFTISEALSRPDKYSWEEVLEEIKKCDVSCANCHRISHVVEDYYGQKGKHKKKK